MQLTGLHDDYTEDGRVLVEGLDPGVVTKALKGTNVKPLMDAYEQVNASFGNFAHATLAASTKALRSTDSTTYNSIEDSITSLTGQRDALVAQIRAALSAAANSDTAIDPTQAQTWIDQANSLITQAQAPASRDVSRRLAYPGSGTHFSRVRGSASATCDGRLARSPSISSAGEGRRRQGIAAIAVTKGCASLTAYLARARQASAAPAGGRRAEVVGNIGLRTGAGCSRPSSWMAQLAAHRILEPANLRAGRGSDAGVELEHASWSEPDGRIALAGRGRARPRPRSTLPPSELPTRSASVREPVGEVPVVGAITFSHSPVTDVCHRRAG